MRMIGALLAIGLAAMGAATAHAAGDDDETVVLRIMSGAGAPGVKVPPERAQRVEFDGLARLAGRRVRIAHADGGEVVGVVERADKDAVLLRTLRSDGIGAITLTRADVRGIRVD
jgi:hypothetical protein